MYLISCSPHSILNKLNSTRSISSSRPFCAKHIFMKYEQYQLYDFPPSHPSRPPRSAYARCTADYRRLYAPTRLQVCSPRSTHADDIELLRSNACVRAFTARHTMRAEIDMRTPRIFKISRAKPQVTIIDATQYALSRRRRRPRAP